MARIHSLHVAARAPRTEMAIAAQSLEAEMEAHMEKHMEQLSRESVRQDGETGAREEQRSANQGTEPFRIAPLATRVGRRPGDLVDSLPRPSELRRGRSLPRRELPSAF
jgi:hypothetical protein